RSRGSPPRSSSGRSWSRCPRRAEPMRPTLRCVLAFAGAVPVSLVAVLVDARLWTLWLGYLGAVALLTGLDAALSLPRRRLQVRATAPELLFIGDEDPLEVELRTRRWPRA